MSGTEAVMAAVRVARFNTMKPLVVTFGGAYHGWWDGMQPYVGNERIPSDVLCLKDMNPLSLAVIKARRSRRRPSPPPPPPPPPSSFSSSTPSSSS